MDDDILQQIEAARFPSSWVGSLTWAQALVKWHFILWTNSWAQVAEDLDAPSEEVEGVVTAVIAAALHATAINEGLDAPDGAQLLHVRLRPVAEFVSDPDRDALQRAVPNDDGTWPQAPEILTSLLTVEEADDLAVQEAVFALACRVLAAHISQGDSLGDRLRSYPDLQQALQRLDTLPYPAAENEAADAPSDEKRLSHTDHRTVLNSLKAQHQVQEAIGKVNPALERELLLVRAAYLDRMVTAFADYASTEQRDNAYEAARALRDLDAGHDRQPGMPGPTESRWEDDPHGYVRQEYTAYLARVSAAPAASPRPGQLTLVQNVTVFAHHTLTAQPRDHICGQGHHRHDYRIQLDLTAPAELVTDDASMRLRTATAALEHADGPLLGKDLDRLGQGRAVRTDERWLAEWVHQWVDAQLPPGLGDYLLVEVEASGLDSVPAVHLGKAL